MQVPPEQLLKIMVISQEKKSGIPMCCTMEKIAWYTLNLQRIAAVAQSVERLACMHIVRCSSPSYDRPKLLNEVLTVPILNDRQDFYLLFSPFMQSVRDFLQIVLFFFILLNHSHESMFQLGRRTCIFVTATTDNQMCIPITTLILHSFLTFTL